MDGLDVQLGQPAEQVFRDVHRLLEGARPDVRHWQGSSQYVGFVLSAMAQMWRVGADSSGELHSIQGQLERRSSSHGGCQAPFLSTFVHEPLLLSMCHATAWLRYRADFHDFASAGSPHHGVISRTNPPSGGSAAVRARPKWVAAPCRGPHPTFVSCARRPGSAHKAHIMG